MKTGQKYIISISTAFIIVILDQATKFLIKSSLQPNQSLPLIENIFHLTYTTNTGSAFGLFKNFNSIFVIISFIVASYIIYYILKSGNKKNSAYIILGMLLGGTIGNLTDRIFFGYVIDFIDFRIWPVFNIADSAVSISIAFLIVLLWKK